MINPDLAVNAWIPSIQLPIFIALAKGIEFLFDTLPLTIISLAVALVIWLRKSRKDAAVFAGVMLLNAIAIEAIKLIVHRARPINGLIQESSYAFPSGHAATALVFFGFLIYFAIKYLKPKKQKSITISLCLLMIVLIGFSRIYLNTHWLTDVLGGFLVGAVMLALSLLTLRILEKNKKS